jgi:hypothetical protein
MRVRRLILPGWSSQKVIKEETLRFSKLVIKQKIIEIN